MNPNPDSPEPDPTDTPSGQSSFDKPPRDWRYWARRLLICNPCFLGSAALLLFGVNRLSVDPNFLSDVTQNLLFNFFALQFYEVLVVVTAIVLARRKIWYDSALLVVLENGLVLVPFMLLSQATLEGQDLTLAWTLTLAGGAVALGRFGAIRRWYRQFNLPPRALLLGAVVLAANVALPLLFRPQMENDVADWRGANEFIWLVALPLLAAGANLLARPARYGGLNPERHWLPLFNYGLWMSGSAVHVWCVAHICNLPLEPHHLAPLACVAAWTIWNRVSDCLPHPSPRWRSAMLLLTFVAPLPALGQPRLFLLLTGLNFAAYLALGVAGREATRSLARHLALASLALMAAGIPEEWGRLVLEGFARRHGLLLGWTLYLILLALRSARPEAGLFGSIAVAADTGWLARELSLHVAAQAGLVFLLIHSLRWRDAAHAGAKFLRGLTAGLWVLDAVLWTRAGGWLETGVTGGIAVAVIVAWLVACWLRKERAALIIPVAAGLALLAGLGNWLARRSAGGLVAILGSLVLFAAGIVVAWTRHRWDHKAGAQPSGESR